MSTKSRLDKLYATCPVMRIVGKVAFFADGHWGGGGPEDDSQALKGNLYAVMLELEKQGYTFIILGDGEDWWEERDRGKIMVAHFDLWELRRRLAKDGRWFEVPGNHNSELDYSEAITLELDGGIKVFCAHWHQLDWLNYQGSWLSRFFVRYIWVPLQWLGAKDPTTAVKEKNPKKHEKVRLKAREWAKKQDFTLFMGGHTHYNELDLEAKIGNAGSTLKRIEAIIFENGQFRKGEWR